MLKAKTPPSETVFLRMNRCRSSTDRGRYGIDPMMGSEPIEGGSGSL